MRNPNQPMSKSLESLLGSYATLVDRRRHFHALQLNSVKNERTDEFVLAVHDPFDDTIAMSDGLLINDSVMYCMACHSRLWVETVELRLAVTTGITVHTRKVWVGWQGPAGHGKTIGAQVRPAWHRRDSRDGSRDGFHYHGRIEIVERLSVLAL